jgi:two-component system sensor histidine kinase KdpD
MEHRPNPDLLLQRVQQVEARQQRGKLKIFFGAAAGVGKTYAMLEAAQQQHAEGIDVVVGYVEPHGRAETEALLEGLESIPTRIVEYRGAQLREFDLDAALARHPQLLLVDELAHTNAPGSRHPKRYQDVEELLAAGIDVYTTVNVQHLESLNDVVAQITGVIVRETVPDQILELADDVKLIDLPPDDLLQRLKEGKVYLPQQADRASKGFFRKGNLIALRELALRRTAERVDAQMEDYRRDHAIRETWPATTRILVGISSGPSASRLVRAAFRMASSLRAEWIVAYVETPAELRRTDTERDQAVQTLRLAEQLGARTVTLSGPKVADELLLYARERNISKIVIGKPESPRWREVLTGSVTNELMRHSGVIDIYVLSGDFGDTEAPPPPPSEENKNWVGYLWAVLGVVVASVITTIMDWLAVSEANLVLIFLLAVLIVALNGGRWPSVLSTVLSVAAFNFLFVEPRLTFSVNDTSYLITFAVMLVVGLVVSTLVNRLRWQVETARMRERRVAALYGLSREFASVRGLGNLLQAAVRHIHEVFDSQVVVLLPNERNSLHPWGNAANELAELSPKQLFQPNLSEQAVAQWVFDHQRMAGLGTDTLPASEAIYLPLIGSRQTVGVLGVRPDHARRVRSPEQIHLLETFASQTALALERAALATEAAQAQVRAETERMRAALLSSVSHDLRTPLAVITGANSSLMHNYAMLDDATRFDLAQTAYHEAERLNRLVSNLLDMTRLEAGAIQVQKEWQPLDEVIGTAIARLEQSNEEAAQLHTHPLTIDLPPDLPLVPLDGVLIEQVLVNLLDNALKYTPVGTPISVRAWAQPEAVVVEVADAGPGLPLGAEQKVFDKFYRGQPNASDHGSVGLGLAICRGMVEAHGGTIWAETASQGGSIFRFTLPLDAKPPPLLPETVTIVHEVSNG